MQMSVTAFVSHLDSSGVDDCHVMKVEYDAFWKRLYNEKHRRKYMTAYGINKCIC